MMETSGLSVVPWKRRDVWRSALMRSGEQCVMIFSLQLMPTWHVDNWDTPNTVSLLVLRSKVAIMLRRIKLQYSWYSQQI